MHEIVQSGLRFLCLQQSCMDPIEHSSVWPDALADMSLNCLYVNQSTFLNDVAQIWCSEIEEKAGFQYISVIILYTRTY